MPRENPEVYVPCRICRKTNKGIFGNEQEVVIGDKDAPIIVEPFFLYKTDIEEPVIKAEEISRSKGMVEIAIANSRGEYALRKVAVDDLIDPNKVTSFSV